MQNGQNAPNGIGSGIENDSHGIQITLTASAYLLQHLFAALHHPETKIVPAPHVLGTIHLLELQYKEQMANRGATHEEATKAPEPQEDQQAATQPVPPENAADPTAE